MAATPGHWLIASLASAKLEELVAGLRQLPSEVDAAEIRLDFLWPWPPDADAATDALLALADAAPVALVATLRPVRQGGGFSGDENVRVGLLVAAARAGFAFLDLEADAASPMLMRDLAREGAQVIVSAHTTGPTPCRDDGLQILTAAQDTGGTFDKFAFAGHSYADTLRALELANQHAQRGGRPVVITPGYGGPEVRALLGIAGNHATYGHAPGLPPATPGQPAAAEIAATWRDWGLSKDELDPTGKPRPWLCVIGSPVRNSLSPRMHNAALRAAGRRERFGALDVPASPGALLLTLHAAARIGLADASVTMPHKRDLARIVPGDAVVQATGAANCIRVTPQGSTSTNTDATSLRRLLEPHVDHGAPAVVLGAGGLGMAAMWALRDLGAAVRFTSRDKARAGDLAKRFGAAWTAWDQRHELRAPVWVQTTPIGGTAGDASPVPAGQMRGAAIVVEGNYVTGPTPFQLAAQAAGAIVIDGRTLLVEQGIDAYRFWFDAAPSRVAMQDAVRPLMEAFV